MCVLSNGVKSNKIHRKSTKILIEVYQWIHYQLGQKWTDVVQSERAFKVLKLPWPGNRLKRLYSHKYNSYVLWTELYPLTLPFIC